MAGFMRLTDTRGTLRVHGDISRNGFLGWFPFNSLSRGTTANLGPQNGRALSNQLTLTRPLDKITPTLFNLARDGVVMEAVFEFVDQASGKANLRVLAHRVAVTKIVGSSSSLPGTEFCSLDCDSLEFKPLA